MNNKNTFWIWVLAIILSLLCGLIVFFLDAERIPNGSCDGGLCGIYLIRSFFYALITFIILMLISVKILKRFLKK